MILYEDNIICDTLLDTLCYNISVFELLSY